MAKLWTSKNGIGIFSNITFLFSEQYVRMILLNKYYSVHSPRFSPVKVEIKKGTVTITAPTIERRLPTIETSFFSYSSINSNRYFWVMFGYFLWSTSLKNMP